MVNVQDVYTVINPTVVSTTSRVKHSLTLINGSFILDLRVLNGTLTYRTRRPYYLALLMFYKLYYGLSCQ